MLSACFAIAAIGMTLASISAMPDQPAHTPIVQAMDTAATPDIGPPPQDMLLLVAAIREEEPVLFRPDRLDLRGTLAPFATRTIIPAPVFTARIDRVDKAV
jgi:hypothetical protein